MAIYKIPDSMRVGPPVLRVRNIDTAMAFYENSLGLQVNRSYKDNSPGGGYYDDVNPIYEVGFKHKFSSSFSFSSSSSFSYEPLLILKHDPNAKKPSLNSRAAGAGLFHFAILVPDRKSLASTYLAVKNSEIQYDGFADHLVSESLYLRDPEDNGIEIYRDRPASEWPRDSKGHIIMDTLALDLNSLLAEMNNGNKVEQTNNAKAFPTGARIGHIHLRVTNLERSIKFYHEKIGLDITVDWSSMGAAFLSAGGRYHHHIGMNTWHSLNGEAHRSGETGLEYFTIIIPDRSFVKTLALRIQQHSSTTTNSKQASENQLLLVSDPDGIQFLIGSE
jgi:catechol 2,3-dioxygenase